MTPFLKGAPQLDELSGTVGRILDKIFVIYVKYDLVNSHTTGSTLISLRGLKYKIRTVLNCWGNWKIHTLHFLSFLDIGMVQLVERHPCFRQDGQWSLESISSASWLLMAWWYMEPGHQEAGWWSSPPLTFWFQNLKNFSVVKKNWALLELRPVCIWGHLDRYHCCWYPGSYTGLKGLPWGRILTISANSLWRNDWK